MRKSRSETLWNEEIRRCGVVDIPEKATEESLRRCGHVTRRDEEELVRRHYGIKRSEEDVRW
jgi:hypothetical protein